MKTAVRKGRVTFDDFRFLVKEDQKADLIDGVIYMASPENTDANSLFMWYGGLLDLYVEELELGKVFGLRVALRLDDTNGPEPDILFVANNRLHLVQWGHVDGPADMAVEIVSPESVDRDYTKKRAQYERARVKEYWIIDEQEEKVTVFHLDRANKYREVKPRDGKYHSKVVRGFWIRPEWLWQNPRPKKMKVLREILGQQ